MKKRFLILGGYGGVGRRMSEELLKHTLAEITISGRNREKAKVFSDQLRKKYPDRTIQASYADCSDKQSMKIAFENVDLVIITATTPDDIDIIAEAALDSRTDMIDILVRGDVVDKLNKYRKRIVGENRIFITQAGFHPGLPAPFIRYARNFFDEYQSANVVMAMNAIFEKPESTHEIIHEIGEAKAKILSNGIWKMATYKDALKIQFSDRFGLRQCFPLQMREIYPLKEELGLLDMGVYSAGFNSFVDNLVFPLTMILQSIKKGWGLRLSATLMHWGIKKYYNNRPGVEFRLEAKGLKEGKEIRHSISAFSDNAFEFTSLAVVACIKQYLDNSISKPDLYLMGNVVNPRRIIGDLEQMGIQTESKEITSKRN